jgi:hypothetical protein
MGSCKEYLMTLLAEDVDQRHQLNGVAPAPDGNVGH